MTQQHTTVTLAEKAVQELADHLRGTLLRPDDAGYEQARQVYNAMIDKHPALIVRCVDVADVIAAVNFARDHQLPLAVRGGGHNGPGLGICDDGLVIDLSEMKGIRVDPVARTIRVAGGCTWGEVDHAAHPFYESSWNANGMDTPKDSLAFLSNRWLNNGDIRRLENNLHGNIDLAGILHDIMLYMHIWRKAKNYFLTSSCKWLNIFGATGLTSFQRPLYYLKNIGLTDTDLVPLFRSAEDYTQTREKCVSRSKAL